MKYEILRDLLKNFGRAAVAFSGGVDSTLLLKVARMTLGDNVVAVHGSSVLQKEGTRQMVRDLAEEIGVMLLIKDYYPLSWPEFVANPPDRCYHCKKNIYTGFLESIPSGYSLLDASQLDDLSQDRPGGKAMRELSVKTPLIEASLNKKEVRCLARDLGLPNWDKPSESCLATRIKYGRPITEIEMEWIACGEEFMTALGFAGCRVKYGEDGVVISLMDGDYCRVGDPVLRRKIGNFFAESVHRQVFLTVSGRPNVEI